MNDLFEEPDDAATPLTSEERRDLIPSHIAYRSELNAAELDNIARGRAWALIFRRREILREHFILDLHRRMLGDVWKWAGRYRVNERNLGIAPWRIATEIRILLDDARIWIDRRVYEPDEIAVRFHHRLVAIHPFPNGNGRHARLMADVMMAKSGREPLSWGSGSLVPSGDLRLRYISALRAADGHDIRPLLAFARS